MGKIILYGPYSKTVGRIDWIHPAHCRSKWRSSVKTAMSLRVPQRREGGISDDWRNYQVRKMWLLSAVSYDRVQHHVTSLMFMHHAPCTMYHTPCTINHAPCTMHHTPCTIHHAPCTTHLVHPLHRTSWLLSAPHQVNAPHFMQLGSSLPCSKQPTTCPYPEPVKSNYNSTSMFFIGVIPLCIVNIHILPSKTQHMYINTVMKYRLHQGHMFRL